MSSDQSVIVISLGGVARRFSEKGIATPKFLLQYQGASILEKIIKNIEYNSHPKVICVVNQRYKVEYGRDIESVLKIKFQSNYELIYCEDTRGQAETVSLALIVAGLNKHCGPLFIINGDTITTQKNIDSIIEHMFQAGADGLIECFTSDSSNFSYIETDKSRLFVKRIVEKVVISNLATTGFYVFSSCELYNRYFEIHASKNISGEVYVSDIYNELLAHEHGLIHMVSTAPEVLGTPEEYFSALLRE